MEQIRIDAMKELVKRADSALKAGDTDEYTSLIINLSGAVTDLLEDVADLEKLVKEVDPNVGDVVREVGEEEATGEIIQIKEGIDENAYIVKLFKPSKHYKAITYYRDEFELMERAK